MRLDAIRANGFFTASWRRIIPPASYQSRNSLDVTQASRVGPCANRPVLTRLHYGKLLRSRDCDVAARELIGNSIPEIASSRANANNNNSLVCALQLCVHSRGPIEHYMLARINRVIRGNIIRRGSKRKSSLVARRCALWGLSLLRLLHKSATVNANAKYNGQQRGPN